MDKLAAFVFYIKGSKEEYKAVIDATKEFYAIKDKFKDRRNPLVDSYPNQVYGKSIVFASKILRKNKFSQIEKSIK